jgi:hypothetical protein
MRNSAGVEEPTTNKSCKFRSQLFLQPANNQQPIANSQQPTANSQQPTANNSQQPTKPWNN